MRLFFFFSSRRRHTRSYGDWSSDVCSSDLSRSGASSRRWLRGASSWSQRWRASWSPLPIRAGLASSTSRRSSARSPSGPGWLPGSRPPPSSAITSASRTAVTRTPRFSRKGRKTRARRSPPRWSAPRFSYHGRQPDGSHPHAALRAEGPQAARPPLAAAMVRATANARRVVMYTSFEKTRIRELQRAVPELATELAALEAKLIDLHPVVKNCVYHPGFRGSFSLKDILTPLVPELTYNDLVIVDGRVASVEIARLLFVADKIPKHERDRVRQDLLNYCERDTWAMVKLVEKLRSLC